MKGNFTKTEQCEGLCLWICCDGLYCLNGISLRCFLAKEESLLDEKCFLDIKEGNIRSGVVVVDAAKKRTRKATKVRTPILCKRTLEDNTCRPAAERTKTKDSPGK